VIVVVAVTGGHRESVTRIELLGFRGDELVRMFTGDIERRDDETVAAGQLRLTAEGLVHRAPDGRITRWRADPWGRTFTREPAR
jgi:hypothetical protein